MKTTTKLSFMMFVEWFIWGAWFVPLWLWLSKSGFSAGEIGWSYACTAIAAILSPILVGSITDRFFSAQKVLAVLMFTGAALMYFAAQQTTFAGFFPLLLAYSLTYMPTIALTNSIAFANVPDVERDFPRIRVMGTIGWIASGLACGFLPQMLGMHDASDEALRVELNRYSLKVQGLLGRRCPTPMLSGYWKNDPFSPEEDSRLITSSSADGKLLEIPFNPVYRNFDKGLQEITDWIEKRLC
ncbi:hypothetical protein BX90_24905 [Escherichia coli O157: str. 2010EL-2045]|nr:hypothetical protein BX90_24905 [Escherichia coli O157: str. 2010EL-2045]